jgi:xanthine dehydrogenase accessory factor
VLAASLKDVAGPIHRTGPVHETGPIDNVNTAQHQETPWT